MFKLEELSGSLIRSGRFKDAIPIFYFEVKMALSRGVISELEMFSLSQDFATVLLNPADVDTVSELGEKMIKLALRIPGLVPVVSEDYEANVKASREAE
jgi:hypothetical protein